MHTGRTIRLLILMLFAALVTTLVRSAIPDEPAGPTRPPSKFHSPEDGQPSGVSVQTQNSGVVSKGRR